MNKGCSLTLIHPASLTAHHALCICLESGWVSGETQRRYGASPPNSPLITLHGGTSLSSWCHLLMQQPRFQLMAIGSFVCVWTGRGLESLAIENFWLPFSNSNAQNKVSKNIYLLNKEHSREWEKSMISFKMMIYQSLLTKQLKTGGGD